MFRFLVALILGFSFVIPTAPAMAAPKPVVTYSKSMQSDAWRVFETAYNAPPYRNTVKTAEYVGSSKRKVSTKTLVSFKSPRLKNTWHVFAINAKRTITKSEFKATQKLLPPCKYESSSRCYWDASKRGNRKGKSFVAYAPRVVSYVK